MLSKGDNAKHHFDDIRNFQFQKQTQQSGSFQPKIEHLSKINKTGNVYFKVPNSHSYMKYELSKKKSTKMFFGRWRIINFCNF